MSFFPFFVLQTYFLSQSLFLFISTSFDSKAWTSSLFRLLRPSSGRCLFAVCAFQRLPSVSFPVTGAMKRKKKQLEWFISVGWTSDRARGGWWGLLWLCLIMGRCWSTGKGTSENLETSEAPVACLLIYFTWLGVTSPVIYGWIFEER